MFPFKKIFVLLIRTFSQPMLRFVRRKQQQKKLKLFSSFFIGLGQKTHLWQFWLNRYILKSTLRTQPTPLNELILLQKGVQSFYQIIFYGLILGMPLYQMYKASQATEKKENKQKQRMKQLQHKMDEINKKIVIVLSLAKQIASQQQFRARQDAKKKIEEIANSKMSELGEDRNVSQSISEKIEEMLQNAVQVIGQEFQDHFDQIQIGQNPSQDVQKQDQTDIGNESQENSETDVQDISTEPQIQVSADETL